LPVNAPQPGYFQTVWTEGDKELISLHLNKEDAVVCGKLTRLTL